MSFAISAHFGEQIRVLALGALDLDLPLPRESREQCDLSNRARLSSCFSILNTDASALGTDRLKPVHKIVSFYAWTNPRRCLNAGPTRRDQQMFQDLSAGKAREVV